VASAIVCILYSAVTCLHHVSIAKLHRLCALTAELSGHNDLNALCTALHHELDDAIASAANSQASEKLVLEALCLGVSAQAAVSDTFGVELDLVFGKVEALLDSACELANALALLAENVLGTGGANNDLCAHGRIADLDAAVASLLLIK